MAYRLYAPRVQAFTLHARLITHILANGQEGGAAVFKRDGRGRVVMEHTGWHRAISDAIGLVPDMEYEVTARHVRMRLTIVTNTDTYVRRYFLDDKGTYNGTTVEQREYTREHEAIYPGTVLELGGCYDSRLISEDQLRALFEALGELVGLSPFGYNLGFGRFSVERLEVQNAVEA